MAMAIDDEFGGESCSRVIFGEKTEVAFCRSFARGGRGGQQCRADGQNAQNFQKSATVTCGQNSQKFRAFRGIFLKNPLEASAA